jgi:hypothetical protein
MAIRRWVVGLSINPDKRILPALEGILIVYVDAFLAARNFVQAMRAKDPGPAGSSPNKICLVA